MAGLLSFSDEREREEFPFDNNELLALFRRESVFFDWKENKLLAVFVGEFTFGWDELWLLEKGFTLGCSGVLLVAKELEVLAPEKALFVTEENGDENEEPMDDPPKTLGFAADSVKEDLGAAADVFSRLFNELLLFGRLFLLGCAC